MFGMATLALDCKDVCHPDFHFSSYKANESLHLLHIKVANNSAKIPTSRILIPVGLDEILLESP